jgi:hypothetical protein
MKNLYRISAALLAVTVAFSAGAVFVGCGDESGGADVTAAPEVTDIAETTAEPGTTAMTEPELPPADFEGYEFRFVLQDDSHGEWKGREFGEGEQTGDTLNDALYERDLKVSELYNISLKPLFTGDLVRLLKNTVTAGDNACDALFIQAPQLTAPAMNGLLFDIKQLPGLDLENPWWDAYAAKTLSIGGRLFFTYGDMNLCGRPRRPLRVLTSSKRRRSEVKSLFVFFLKNVSLRETNLYKNHKISPEKSGDILIR